MQSNYYYALLVSTALCNFASPHISKAEDRGDRGRFQTLDPPLPNF
ncbi:MAG: hypothetical protein LH702_14010 [Phormidesmis sp. CAN_BIN44]|nr:hypothetical protein [Phormidesmis sp. CAN_BIN44]